MMSKHASNPFSPMAASRKSRRRKRIPYRANFFRPMVVELEGRCLLSAGCMDDTWSDGSSGDETKPAEVMIVEETGDEAGGGYGYVEDGNTYYEEEPVYYEEEPVYEESEPACGETGDGELAYEEVSPEDGDGEVVMYMFMMGEASSERIYDEQVGSEEWVDEETSSTEETVSDDGTSDGEVTITSEGADYDRLEDVVYGGDSFSAVNKSYYFEIGLVDGTPVTLGDADVATLHIGGRAADAFEQFMTDSVLDQSGTADNSFDSVGQLICSSLGVSRSYLSVDCGGSSSAASGDYQSVSFISTATAMTLTGTIVPAELERMSVKGLIDAAFEDLLSPTDPLNGIAGWSTDASSSADTCDYSECR